MNWIIFFIFSWILFFVCIRFRELKWNVWTGVLAVMMQLLVDTFAGQNGLFHIENSYLNLSASSVFFVFGPVLTIGILFSQFHPKQWSKSLFHVLVISGLYSAQEGILLLSGDLIYTRWSYWESLIVNLSAFIILSWFSIVILKKEVKSH